MCVTVRVFFELVSAPKDSKAVGGTVPTALPSSPRPCRAPIPSHGIGRVVELAVEQGEMMLHLSPSFANTAQSDRGRIAPVRVRCCDLRATPRRILYSCDPGRSMMLDVEVLRSR
jgi:hypothetical protein